MDAMQLDSPRRVNKYTNKNYRLDIRRKVYYFRDKIILHTNTAPASHLYDLSPFQQD